MSAVPAPCPGRVPNELGGAIWTILGLTVDQVRFSTKVPSYQIVMFINKDYSVSWLSWQNIRCCPSGMEGSWMWNRMWDGDKNDPKESLKILGAGYYRVRSLNNEKIRFNLLTVISVFMLIIFSIWHHFIMLDTQRCCFFRRNSGQSFLKI